MVCPKIIAAYSEKEKRQGDTGGYREYVIFNLYLLLYFSIGNIVSNKIFKCIKNKHMSLYKNKF